MLRNISFIQTLTLILIAFLLALTLQPIEHVSGLAGISWETYPYSPRVGELVTFDTTASNRWANETFGPVFYSYSWELGDGTVATGEVVSHIYTSPGNYTIEMNTTSDTGGWGSTQRLLSVSERTPLMAYASLSVDRVFTGEEVIIKGNLTDEINGIGVFNETINLSWTTSWRDTWHYIDSVRTDNLGEFSIKWRPPQNQRYEIRVSWNGNSTYSETSTIIVLSVIPLGDLITGFSSNSTIAGMNFNLTTQVLTFTASGPDGTSGHVNITLKKTPEFSSQNITVLLDNQPIPYSINSVDENTLLLTISYMHSTHSVLVSLVGNQVIPEWPSATILLVMFLVFVTPAIILLKKFKTAK